MQTHTGNDITVARQHLLNGELVAIPTETVYGLAANALDEKAVIKIFEVKNRPTFNPLIIHCASWQQAQQFVKNVPVKAIYLAERFTPGPLTFLLDKQPVIPDLVTAGSPKVAVRIPVHPMAQALLQCLEFPLAAPSANPFGYISPTSAQHVLQNLSGKIPYVLDGGQADVGVESTIIGFDEANSVVVHRLGGISIEDIEAVLQEKVLLPEKQYSHNPITPGQLKSHYAPSRPLFVGDVESLRKDSTGKKLAVISFIKRYSGVADENQFILSPSGLISEAATNLFAVLRAIDQLDFDLIIAEKFPVEGLGRAINDRLQRASSI